MLKTHDWYESYETPFLFKNNVPKLFWSFRVGLKSAFFETSEFLLALYFCEARLIIVQVKTLSRQSKNHLYDEAQNSDFYLCIHKMLYAQDLLVRIAKVRACFFVIKLSFKWQTKISNFFCSGHVTKNMLNKKINE